MKNERFRREGCHMGMKNGMKYMLAAAVVLLCSCSAMRDLTSAYPGREDRDETVMTNVAHGKKHIVLYLDRQSGELYVDGKRGLLFPISTGIPGHSTPTGNFSIFAKEKNNRSSLYGTIYDAKGNVVVPYANTRTDRVPPGGYYLGANMPFTMRFTELCAFHEGIVPEEPTLTSHGCVHLTPEVAEELFAICPEGTPVKILATSGPVIE